MTFRKRLRRRMLATGGTLVALAISTPPLDAAQVVRVPSLSIVPTATGIAVQAAGLSPRVYPQIGIRSLPNSPQLQIGGLSKEGVVQQYESPRVEIRHPVIVVPPPKVPEAPPAAHVEEIEWEQVCSIDSTDRANPRLRCMLVPKR